MHKSVAMKPRLTVIKRWKHPYQRFGQTICTHRSHLLTAEDGRKSSQADPRYSWRARPLHLAASQKRWGRLSAKGLTQPDATTEQTSVAVKVAETLNGNWRSPRCGKHNTVTLSSPAAGSPATKPAGTLEAGLRYGGNFNPETPKRIFAPSFMAG